MIRKHFPNEYDLVAGQAVAIAPQAKRTSLLPADWMDDALRLLDRRTPGAGLLEVIVFVVFCAVLCLCIPHHESWFDEAQAWLIARDASLPDLLLHRLHYEGAPAFWHLLLWIEIRLHLSFLGMHIVAGVLSAAGVAVWLRFNPLPRVVSLLIPLGFFLQYQYAVVARSYILAPLFSFILMALYANRRSSVMWFCVVAGLLANCSLHMAALSAGLTLLYFRDRIRAMGFRVSRALLMPMFVLALFFAAAVATAMPTPDGSSTTGNPIVSKLRSIFTAPNAASASVNAEIVWDAPATNTEPAQSNKFADLLWHTVHTEPNASANQRLKAACAKHLIVLLTAITAPISTSNVLALAFLALLVTVVWRARVMWSLAPYALVQLCNLLISGEAHHLGLVWIAILTSLWAVAVQPVNKHQRVAPLRLLYAMTMVIAALQVGWSFHAVSQDIKLPYSSSKAVAEFLSHLPQGTRVAAFDDDSVTVNAYLPRRPYFNQQIDYWPFSRTRNADLFLGETMASRPDIVILKMASPISPVMDQWVRLTPPGTELKLPILETVRAAGYQETARFCGWRFFRNTAEAIDCRLIYQPVKNERPLPILR